MINIDDLMRLIDHYNNRYADINDDNQEILIQINTRLDYIEDFIDEIKDKLEIKNTHDIECDL